MLSLALGSNLIGSRITIKLKVGNKTALGSFKPKLRSPFL